MSARKTKRHTTKSPLPKGAQAFFRLERRVNRARDAASAAIAELGNAETAYSAHPDVKEAKAARARAASALPSNVSRGEIDDSLAEILGCLNHAEAGVVTAYEALHRQNADNDGEYSIVLSAFAWPQLNEAIERIEKLRKMIEVKEAPQS